MILPISLTIAGAAGLLTIWLAMRVSMVRRARKISVGDGGDPLLLGRIRAHANFIENTPLVLILLALVEFARGTNIWLWLVGAFYILGRIAHAYGMDADRPQMTQMRLRAVGMGVTLATILTMSIYAIATPYLSSGTITTELVPAG
ncbi:hypothetical protein FHS96_001931 [Sphingomonas zeicaulis]|uniref:MAPEG family protein n=1 Tax=Sphingomonas zeicaulis TaxID=1632740 RepID=UPI003D1A070F